MIEKSDSEAVSPDPRTVILIPIRNDWESLDLLLLDLDRVLVENGIGARVLVVDDDSTIAPGEELARRRYERLGRVDVLHLRRNLGHQRAIAIGLAYLEARDDCQQLIAMDGDGEDDPRDVPRLLAKGAEEGWRKIVFAERTRRSESRTFRVFYFLYRLLHYLLTGYHVRVGNFSAIPRGRLVSLVAVSELWNHYAAAAFRSRQPYCTIPTRRARRLRGRSSMDFVDLVTHGLRAISVYGELIGVRLLVLSGYFSLLVLAGIVAIAYIRLMTDWAIPGWATYSTGILLILLIQVLMLSLIFCLFILGGRQASSFLPCRDYVHFVRDVETLVGPPEGSRREIRKE
jgi:glycosyltransferase involved in cell wall biosynthesis